ncbi:acetyl-CoA decarbonylase/synthase complex subunit alpha/beta [Dehalogenimonas etheniformans]|uniref:CO-methylating acetyl-CoA synthase n=1 Tax=Dehalogenimonas etheniformans TaxID=1536648 RepID=A0A2P5P9E9_9CHLR|nr:acetyl-CoA decarbonylase/synthase complex subunit alpha/beta [Dehalogenimonas etheniformans]PPD58929.1 CO dehydrogenase/CO-methylating acetyl-CoA synthase complex subunit beta [Dehalogenimonas etheniformans]QNT76304.1 CO dehydrogenase/CO-methylating acetyl-CoA synthase complex subunit beta [Dehalogenimonas etheniformans]
MSNLIASATIKGAHSLVDRAETAWQNTLARYGTGKLIGFPNTAYFLPVIYGVTAQKVQTLGDAAQVIQRCRDILPGWMNPDDTLSSLEPVLNAGLAALFAEEIIEAIRYLEMPDFYTQSEDPRADNVWLGAADDIILRKRGVEFVDGSAPGFAAILGAAPSNTVAAKIATDLQQKNLYTFMSASSGGRRMSEQLLESGVQVGWPTRLVSFGPDVSSTVFAIGFAVRVALSFGNIVPGRSKELFEYCKNRVYAFVMALGDVNEEWVATAAGALNFGFPVIADTPIPEIPLAVVADVPHDKIVNRAIDVRGLKIVVNEVPVPVAYGPAYEGERVRGEDIYLECGGGRTPMVEWVTSKPIDDVVDGLVTVNGPDVNEVSAGAKLPLAILVEVAGRQMQDDYEPILERQIHHLINYAQGVMHIGQRDIAWLRISKGAVEKGFRLEHIGKLLHAKLHQDFGRIFDKLQIKIYTSAEDVLAITAKAKEAYAARDSRVAGMTDESVDTFYSCLLCQSFAPSHVCVISPERTGLCGSYNWMDCKASFEINPLGPNQPVPKGQTLEPRLGQWKGVNEFVFKASRGAVDHYNFYSIISDPMTACGCMECISAILPLCNGVMTVNREFTEMTPCGMKFTTLAGTIGGGVTTPGFVGHSKYNITQRKFLAAEDGIKRLVWMPRSLKEEVSDLFNERANEIGIPDLLSRIADETIGTTEEEILPFLTEKNHPALSLDPLL